MIVSLKGHSLNFVIRQRPLLFYQNGSDAWFRTEKFAGKAHWGDFDVSKDGCPAAAYALAYVRRLDASAEILWAKDYVRTNDTDSEGEMVYVGRVAQYGGFQVHRKVRAPA